MQLETLVSVLFAVFLNILP